jgi:Region in Clathrin and VPS
LHSQVALDHGEHDAAFEIYRKGGHKVEALTVLTDRCRDLNRAHEFATKVDDPTVWSTLGHKQLEAGAINDAIGSYLLAKVCRGDRLQYARAVCDPQRIRLVPARERSCCTVCYARLRVRAHWQFPSWRWSARFCR